MIFLPVGTLPVKEIFRTRGSAVIQAPTSSLPPTTLSTPAGTRARNSVPSSRELRGVKGEGFATTVFPASRAGPSLAARVAIG